MTQTETARPGYISGGPLARILTIAGLAIFTGASSFGAISASTIWEIRASVGNDTNGGAFVSGASGTDYSQNDNKNAAACTSCGSSTVNLSTADVVATGTATVTSATANFTAAIVGNVIHLSGTGITAGWYQVVTFTNSTTIVLDVSPGTGTATSGIGGALLTIGTAVTNSVSANIFYIKATATYTITSTITFPNTFLGSQFIGYTTSRTDNGQATITTATNSTPIFTRANNQGAVAFVNLIMTNSAGTRAAAYAINSGNNNDQRVIFDNCVLDGVSTATSNASFEFYDPIVFNNTEVKNVTLDGFRTTINTQYIVFILNSYFHNNTLSGVQFGVGAQPTSQSSLTVLNSIFKSNGVDGIELNVPNGLGLNIQNSAFISNVTDGIFLNPGTGAGNEIYGQISNNVFQSNGTAIHVNAATGGGFYLQIRSNAYLTNTNTNITLTAGALVATVTSGAVTLGSDAFVNTAGNNFALNNTASAGAACRGAGFPGVLTIGGTGFIDIGPLQHQAVAAGATGAPIIQ